MCERHTAICVWICTGEIQSTLDFPCHRACGFAALYRFTEMVDGCPDQGLIKGALISSFLRLSPGNRFGAWVMLVVLLISQIVVTLN